MVQLIKQKVVSFLLILAIVLTSFLGLELISINASADGTLTVAQINSVIDWAVNQLGNESWVNQWGNTIESIDSEGGNCASFVHTAFNINGMEYAGPNASGWYQNPERGFIVHYGEEPPRGTIALYNGGYWGHVALSLGNGRVIQAGLYDWVDITSYDLSSRGLTYVGWCSYDNMALPTYDPIVTPTPHLVKTTYNVGETINFTWDASSANSALHHYWINLSLEGSGGVFDLNAGRTPSYSYTVNTPGKYVFQVWADDLRGDGCPCGVITFDVVVACIHDWSEWTNYPMSEAAPACRMRTCKICGEVQSEDIICDGANHTLEKREAVEATCTQTGRIEFWICSLCNLKFADANGTTPINDVTAPIKEHNWGEWITYSATEAAEAYRTRACKTCGEVQTEVLVCDGKNHTLEKREAVEATCTQTGRIEFWICSLCNLKFADANGTTEINDVTAPKKDHNWGEWITYSATEAAEAYRTRNCKTCGEVQTEVLVCDGKNHTLEKRESIEATCTETGRIEFWVCSLCNMKFADVNGNKPINDITVPAKGHNWNNGVVTKPATTTSAGVKTFTCTVCGETKTESISKLPNSGSGASSGSGSSSSRRPSITSSSKTAETVIVNGSSKTWAETVTTIDSTAINGIVTISGSTDTPSNVIAAAAKKNVKLEVRVNDTFTWVIDAAKMDEGSKYLSVSDSVITATNKTIKNIEYSKDFRITESKLGTGSTLRYNAGRTNSGKFANLFKVDGSNLIFVGVSMADTAGNALLPITTAGTYKIVTSNETKLVGDLNNSMNLNALDAAIMLKKLVNGNIPAEEVAKFDFNGDGNANALDAAAILKYILNK